MPTYRTATGHGVHSPAAGVRLVPFKPWCVGLSQQAHTDRKKPSGGRERIGGNEAKGGQSRVVRFNP